MDAVSLSCKAYLLPVAGVQPPAIIASRPHQAIRFPFCLTSFSLVLLALFGGSATRQPRPTLPPEGQAAGDEEHQHGKQSQAQEFPGMPQAKHRGLVHVGKRNPVHTHHFPHHRPSPDDPWSRPSRQVRQPPSWCLVPTGSSYFRGCASFLDVIIEIQAQLQSPPGQRIQYGMGQGEFVIAGRHEQSAEDIGLVACTQRFPHGHVLRQS